MEYSMRKPTQDMSVELTGKDGAPIGVAVLSAEDLLKHANAKLAKS
jgi:hypothetical protein